MRRWGRHASPRARYERRRAPPGDRRAVGNPISSTPGLPASLRARNRRCGVGAHVRWRVPSTGAAPNSETDPASGDWRRATPRDATTKGVSLARARVIPTKVPTAACVRYARRVKWGDRPVPLPVPGKRPVLSRKTSAREYRKSRPVEDPSLPAQRKFPGSCSRRTAHFLVRKPSICARQKFPLHPLGKCEQILFLERGHQGGSCQACAGRWHSKVWPTHHHPDGGLSDCVAWGGCGGAAPLLLARAC